MNHGRRERFTEEVVQASGVLGDCLYDLRMAMPNQARHLPGCLVWHAVPAGRVDIVLFSMGDNFWVIFGAVVE